jgi:membrane protein
MKLKEILNVFKLAFQEFGKDRASTLGAALAYYTIFSIGPLLIVAIGIAGAVFGEAAARGEVMNTIESFMGEDGAKTIQGIVENAHQPGAGLFATILGIIGLVLGAMGIFGQLKTALNRIWEVPPPQGGIVNMVFTNLLTFVMVLVFVAVLMLSLVATAGLTAVGPLVTQQVPGGVFLWQLVTYGVTLAIFTLTFAMMFKVLPDLDISWKDVWLGAFIAALLFMLGQIAIGLYVSLTNVGSAFGAASSLVVLLVWVYYSAQILLFGAEIAQVYANNYGSHPKARQLRFRFPRFRRRGAALDDTAIKKIDAEVGDTDTERTGRRTSPWFN